MLKEKIAMKNLIENLTSKVCKNKVILIFLFFIILIMVVGLFYISLLSPSLSDVNDIICKFKTDDYSLPYNVAERYVVWNNMRIFFTSLDYALNLLGLIANLMTVFYAGTSNKEDIHKRKVIFLSLISTCFTVANLFINSERQASTLQHAWRELDCCITQTISDSSITKDEKDRIIIDKFIEIEAYIETKENL